MDLLFKVQNQNYLIVQFIKETTSKVELDKAQAELPLSEETQTSEYQKISIILKLQLQEILKILK
jgi:hypothetical protein